MTGVGLAARLWSKVVGGDVDTCWIWTGLVDDGGYGVLMVVVDGRWTTRRVHRLVYEALRGEIPAGLVLDHLCRRPPCVNPWHLEPVTQRVNLLRGLTIAARRAGAATCEAGHPWSAASTYVYPRNGTRHCLVCRRAASRRRYAARRATGVEPA